MVLSYAKYIDLMTALDEYSEGKLERHELQNAIFDHYMKMSNSLVAENINGSKRLFIWKLQKGKQNARERKIFRNFMNEEVKTKKKKKKLCNVSIYKN